MIVARCGKYPEKKYPLKKIEKVADNFMSHAGLNGEFEIMVSKYCKGTRHMKKIYVVKNIISRIILRIRIGNNKCFFIILTVPPEFSGRSGEFFERLKNAAENFKKEL